MDPSLLALSWFHFLFTSNQIKCHQYWPIGKQPGVDDVLDLPDVGLKVQHLSETEASYYITRVLRFVPQLVYLLCFILAFNNPLKQIYMSTNCSSCDQLFQAYWCCKWRKQRGSSFPLHDMARFWSTPESNCISALSFCCPEKWCTGSWCWSCSCSLFSRNWSVWNILFSWFLPSLGKLIEVSLICQCN